ARLGLGDGERFVLWMVACFLVLGLTVWAVRRVLRSDQPVLALICVAMFGLVVSPVSWSHHWVWALPTVLVISVVAYRQRHIALGLVAPAGIALMVWTPIPLMPEHHETSASLLRQLAGGSYVWWAIAVIAFAGTVAARRADRSVSPQLLPASAPAASRSTYSWPDNRISSYITSSITARSMNRLPARPSNRLKSIGLPNLTWTRPNRHILLPGGLTKSVPIIATGMTGTPLSSASRPRPVLPLYSRPSGERVPS